MDTMVSLIIGTILHTVQYRSILSNESMFMLCHLTHVSPTKGWSASYHQIRAFLHFRQIIYPGL